jgi:hypothetical protein
MTLAGDVGYWALANEGYVNDEGYDEDPRRRRETGASTAAAIRRRRAQLEAASTAATEREMELALQPRLLRRCLDCTSARASPFASRVRSRQVRMADGYDQLSFLSESFHAPLSRTKRQDLMLGLRKFVRILKKQELRQQEVRRRPHHEQTRLGRFAVLNARINQLEVRNLQTSHAYEQLQNLAQEQARSCCTPLNGDEFEEDTRKLRTTLEQEAKARVRERIAAVAQARGGGTEVGREFQEGRKRSSALQLLLLLHHSIELRALAAVQQWVRARYIIHSLMYSLIHSLIYSLIHSLMHSLIHSLIYSLIHSSHTLSHTLSYTLSHTLSHTLLSYTLSCTLSYTPLIHSLMHSSLIHSVGLVGFQGRVKHKGTSFGTPQVLDQRAEPTGACALVFVVCMTLQAEALWDILRTGTSLTHS